MLNSSRLASYLFVPLWTMLSMVSVVMLPLVTSVRLCCILGKCDNLRNPGTPFNVILVRISLKMNIGWLRLRAPDSLGRTVLIKFMRCFLCLTCVARFGRSVGRPFGINPNELSVLVKFNIVLILVPTLKKLTILCFRV